MSQEERHGTTTETTSESASDRTTSEPVADSPRLLTPRYPVQRQPEVWDSSDPPAQERMTLLEMIRWAATYMVEIPETVALEIEAFDQRWEAKLSYFEKLQAQLRFNRPACQLAWIYRQADAAKNLYHLLKAESDRVWWYDWSITDSIEYKLDDERKIHRAFAILERFIKGARDLFDAIIDGHESDQQKLQNFLFDVEPSERRWIDSVGFLTKEIFSCLRPDHGGEAEPTSFTAPVQKPLTSTPEGASEGLTKLERQIQLIEASAVELGYDCRKIPRGGKKEIRYHCEDKSPGLFGKRGGSFDDAWQKAVAQNRIRMKDHAKFSGS